MVICQNLNWSILIYCFEYQQFLTIHFNLNVMAYQVNVPHLAQTTELVDAEKQADLTSYYSTGN